MFQELDWLVFIFPLIILFGILESVLTLLWTPFYMRIGIPISITRFPILKREEFEDVSARLLTEGLVGKWYPSLAFKQISDRELAFKNKLFEFKIGLRSRSPVRGIIILDPSYQVVIRGFLPFSTPLVLIIFIAFFVTVVNESFAQFSDRLTILPMFIIIFGASFLIQFAVYRQISQRIKDYFEQSSII